MEQYASLVARNEGEWRATVADIDDACTDPDAVAICAASYLTAGFRAEAFRLELSGAHDPECQTNPACLYLGEVPTEIAVFVASTEAAAAEYIAAYRGGARPAVKTRLTSSAAAGRGSRWSPGWTVSLSNLTRGSHTPADWDA